MFPFNVYKFNKRDSEIFNKYFLDKDTNEFCFEGMWFRNQRPENKNQSGYVDDSTVRRRYIHFYNTYFNNNNFLSIKHFYLIVSNTLPKEENSDYLNKILNMLSKKKFEKISETLWQKDGLQVIINVYEDHPKNKLCKAVFPKTYNSVDVIIKDSEYDYQAVYDRMWLHSTKLFRIPDKRENPLYVNSLDEIKKYLPAQVEFGCGPSIEADIDPLYYMHEMYKVQNHETKHFYFGEEDDLILSIINNPKKKMKEFSQTPKKCIQAKHTNAYKIFNKLYKKNIFVGMVYNNNFDRLVKRFDIPETILRTYQLDTYIQKIDFDPRAKSLICFGTHADRRQVEKQAREKGLKVIYIDPEGFFTDNGFVEYKIEGPKSSDIILKETFTNAMNLFEKEFLIKK